MMIAIQAATLAFTVLLLTNVTLQAFYLEKISPRIHKNACSHQNCRHACRHHMLLQAQQSGDINSSKESKRSEMFGYRFGDITRSLTGKLNEKASQITGKENYKFGDLSKWADRRAKDRIMSIKSQTGEYKYEFGDISRLADNMVKQQAANYAGKENATDYRFGDITKTLLKKVLIGEYDPQDVYLALRILIVAGCTLLPIAQLLPINTLFEIFELGLVKDVGFRLLPLVATTIDERMKEALTSNANYQLGDITKERLRQHLARFTGKEAYEFGDITATIIKRQEEEKNGIVPIAVTGGEALVIDDPTVYDELTSWDQRFLENKHSSALAE